MRETIAALPTVGVHDSVGKFDTVKTFLARFGYLERAPQTRATDRCGRRGRPR